MSRSFSAVAVDLHLPDVGADDVVPRVLVATAGVAPVIVLTGLRDEAKAIALVASGADNFVQKASGYGSALRRQLHFSLERFRQSPAATKWRSRLARWAHDGELRWVWSIKPSMVEANAAWLEAIPETSATTSGRSWLSRVHDGDRRGVSDALDRVSSGDAPAWEMPLRIRRGETGFVGASLKLGAVWTANGVPRVVRGSVAVSSTSSIEICRQCGRYAGQEAARCPGCPSSASAPVRATQVSGPIQAEIVIANRYEVKAKLASGGSGVVYRVHDEQSGEVVALKLLHAHLAQDMTARSRFSREARLQLTIRHPNILPVLDYGSHDGSPYLVLPLVTGGSMAQHLAQYGPFPIAEVLRYGAGLAEALDVAHRAGVVHRDVKPGNVLLEYEGETANVRLTDFGVAKPLLESAATLTGSVLGTLQYLAPEQLEDSTAVTHRSDQYSLGATIFEMLVGEPPDWKQVFGQGLPVANDNRLEGQPAALVRLIRRAMSYDASDRYRSCRVVAHELNAIAQSIRDEGGAA